MADLDLERLVDTTLAAQSASARTVCLSVATATRAAYLRTDPAARRRWPRTGTSIASASILDTHARHIAAAIHADRAAGNIVDLTNPLAAIQFPELLLAVLNLAEAPRPGFVIRRGASGFTIDPALLLRRWLEGQTLPALVQEFLPLADRAWRIEQMVDYCSSMFEHYLSWTLGALVELVNTHLRDTTTDLAFDAWFCPELGSYVRYGVHDPRALIMMASGIRSRRLIHAIVADLPPDLGASIDALRTWIAGSGIHGWRTTYGASAPEILDLLDFMRIRKRSFLRSLLETATATIDLPAQHTILSGVAEPLTLEPQRGVAAPAPLAVYAGNQLVAEVSVQDQADLSMILDSGLVVLR